MQHWRFAGTNRKNQNYIALPRVGTMISKEMKEMQQHFNPSTK